MSEGLTSTETLLGTPQYMSPEQVKSSKNVDRRSDVWALGVIFYELVTGELPFRASHGSDGYGEVFGLILFKEPEPPSKARPGIPLELEAIILECLRKDPSERFQSIAALATALSPLASASSQRRIQSVRHSMPEIDVSPAASEPKLAVAAAVAKTLPAAAASPPPARRDPSPVTAAPTTRRVTTSERTGTRSMIGAGAALATIAAIVTATAPVETVVPLAAVASASASIQTPPHDRAPVAAPHAPAHAAAEKKASPHPASAPTAAPAATTLILDRK